MRKTQFALATLLFLSALVACSKGEKSNADTSQGAAPTTTNGKEGMRDEG